MSEKGKPFSCPLFSWWPTLLFMSFIIADITMINRYGESGHPCLMPLSCGLVELAPVVEITLKVGALYMFAMTLMYLSGIFILFSAGTSAAWSILSNAFSQ